MLPPQSTQDYILLGLMILIIYKFAMGSDQISSTIDYLKDTTSLMYDYAAENPAIVAGLVVLVIGYYKKDTILRRIC